MAVTDDKTPHLAIQLPHPSNLLEDDVLRLRSAITAIDTKFEQLDNLLASDDLSLDTIQELVNAIKLATADLIDHVGSGGAVHAAATGTVAGFMSAADKQKLDGVSLGVTYDAVVVAATTVGQTSFAIPGGYTAGAIEVLLDGIELDSSDFTATNGTDVVLASGVESASSKLKVRRLKQCLRA